MNKLRTTIFALIMLYFTYVIVWDTSVIPLYFQMLSTITIITGIVAMYTVERKEKKGV